jgi:anaerobic magnesium-protoporphyrin IX monomethyl ester cyclase
MNILLLRPHYDTRHRPAGFPIGIAYLAAAAEQAGHCVRVLDLVLHPDWQPALAEALAAGRFDLAGISCMSVQFQGARAAAERIRALSPGTRMVFGGAHPSITPEETLGLAGVDFVIRGEGELPFLDLLAALESGAGLAEVGSLSFRDDGRAVHNPMRSAYPSPDELPWPAYHLFPMERYFELEIPGFPSRHPRPFQIFTSRGCPYRCIYCHNLFGKGFRPRAPESVLAEMRHLHDTYGVREFLVYDDNFTMDLARARRICELILASGMRIGLQFPNGIRADRVDEPLIEAMVAAGAHSVTIGVESGSPRIQKLIRKSLRLEKVAECLRLARRHGLVTHGAFILGFPGETVADAWQTIRFARRSELDYAFFAFATPYPGTELHDLAVAQGLPMRMVADDMDVTTPHIDTREMGLRKVRWMYLLAYGMFYTRPRRLARFLASLFRPRMLAKYVRGLGKYVLPAIFPNRTSNIER